MAHEDYADELDALATKTGLETETLSPMLWRQLSKGLLMHTDAEADKVMAGVIEHIDEGLDGVDSDAEVAFVDALGEAIADVGIDLAYREEEDRVRVNHEPDVEEAPVGGLGNHGEADSAEPRTNTATETDDGEAPVGGIGNHDK